MEIVQFSQIQDILVEMIKGKKLIPIIGAGFTKNEKTRSGRDVPDAEQLKNYVIDEIVKNPEFSHLKDELSKKNFN